MKGILRNPCGAQWEVESEGKTYPVHFEALLGTHAYINVAKDKEVEFTLTKYKGRDEDIALLSYKPEYK